MFRDSGAFRQGSVDERSFNEDRPSSPRLWVSEPLAANFEYSLVPVKDEPTYDASTFVPAEPGVCHVIATGAFPDANPWGVGWEAPDLGSSADGWETEDESDEASAAADVRALLPF